MRADGGRHVGVGAGGAGEGRGEERAAGGELGHVQAAARSPGTAQHRLGLRPSRLVWVSLVSLFCLLQLRM
eukprot:3732375-Rhodomonas_salina.1